MQVKNRLNDRAKKGFEKWSVLKEDQKVPFEIRRNHGWLSLQGGGGVLLPQDKKWGATSPLPTPSPAPLRFLKRYNFLEISWQNFDLSSPWIKSRHVKDSISKHSIWIRMPPDLGSCHRRRKPQAPTPQAPVRNRQTRKVANAKVRIR